MGKIKIRDLLEVMAPALVKNPPSTVGENEYEDEFSTGEELKYIISLVEQARVVEKAVSLVIGKEGEFISMPIPMAEEKEFEVKTFNFFVMYVDCEKWQGDEYFNCLHIKGFDTLNELKGYLEETNRSLPVVHLYVKDLNTYKEVRFKGYYDTDDNTWDNVEIPCLCEIEEIQFEKGKDLITIHSSVGLFTSISLIEEYLTFLIAEGYFEKGVEFMVEGAFKYERKEYYYKMSSDGMTFKLDYCLPR